MIQSASNLFGFSTVIANARASALGITSLREKICLAFTVSFGYGEYISKSIYQQIKSSNINLNGISIGSNYDTIEQKVYNILDNNYPTESPINKKILALSVNALLFSYYTYNDIDVLTIQSLINSLLFNTCLYVTNNQLFSFDSKGNISTPFSVNIIQNFLQENYSLTIQSLSQEPKTSNIEVVNYNWMEVSDIFAQPNLNLMKDIENQYYYLSGQLLYSSSLLDNVECMSIPVTITTSTGQVTFNYYLQEPCIEKNTYKGPVTGVSFYRIFNDGPYTSGNFNNDIKNAYIQFDKNVLTSSGYSSNSKMLYSFLTGSDSGFLPISLSPVFIDANGQYNLNQEYSNIPESFSCSNTYSGNMHIGNNAPKIICDRDEFNNCINCRFVQMTGFKFASLELDKKIWNKRFANIKTNPFSSVDNILKRALNILPNPYLSVINEDSYNTIGPSNTQYLGYPQLTGQNALPNIAFFQDFNSPNFNKNASLSMYPAIGISNNGIDEDSDRQYQISPLNIFSGISTTNVPLGISPYSLIKFKNSIHSSGLINDNIAQQFFGMGNNFDNKFNIITTSSNNAGLSYTGFYIQNSGIYTNIVFANLLYENQILGSKINNINFISGYISDIGDKYIVKKIYAQDSGNNLIPYYYLKNEDLPFDLKIQENQTNIFCPLPDILESKEFLYHLSGSQTVENYLPRFASGAFATFEQKFLYPNAQNSLNTYNGKINGFPIRINFTLNIREETIREFYARFVISNNGAISSSPRYMNVIRPNENGQIDTTKISPTMYDIFVPNNNLYSKDYDFNNFEMNSSFYYSSPTNMVDNNWSPYIDRYFSSDSSGRLTKNFYQADRLPSFYNTFATPSGKNSSFAEDGSNPFYQGVRLTGNGSIYHKWFTGTGNNDFKIFYDEQPYLNGLFHYYEPLQISGYLLYTPPYFDLSSGTGYINEAIKLAFKTMVDNNSNYGPINCHSSYDIGCAQVQNSYTQNISGITGYIKEGVDPLFLEYMGGRSGGINIQEEGGYHSKGLIGDSWNFFNFQAYGMLGNQQFMPCGNPTRWPSNDNKLILITSSLNGTNIFTRALSFNPFIINQYPYIAFAGNENYPYTINGVTSSLGLIFQSGFAKVDLSIKMPLKNVPSGGFYDKTGLILGPFDRDMELGVLNGDMLYPINGNLFCNGNQITDISGFGGCDANSQFYGRNSLNSGIIPNENGRNGNFTIFAIIGKGNTAILNISGIDSSNQFGFNHLISDNGSGRNLNNTWLSLRPRKIIGASKYDQNIHFGEESWTSPFSFLNNGLEKKYQLSNSKFEDLASNIFTITTYSKSGKLYPKPFEDFTGLAKIDIYGNFIYPSNVNVENYWKNYAIKNNQIVITSGWREGSRLSFQFANISVEYDTIPYQTQKIVIPSGECTISGEMGYLSQADASIYTAGVVLKDNTEETKNEFDNYMPTFSSDVLNRLPWATGFINKYSNPILTAPSVMIQREFVEIISGGQSYKKLLNYSPNNYNKLNWSALSDLETLNNGETLEAILPTDPITFNNSNIIFSASQGQDLPNGKRNPDINQTYDVIEAYQTYDSLATDAIINSGICITTGYGTKNRLEQKTSLSGIIAPINMTLSMIKNGFI